MSNKDNHTKNDNEIVEEKEDVKKDNLQNEHTENTAEDTNDVLNQEISKKEQEIESLNDRLLRTVAEYDNYRKRTSKQLIEKESEVTAKTIGEFLPVVDNLERACENVCSDEKYKEGIDMILSGFKEILSKLGVEEIDTEQGFDPNLHQAVQQIEAEGKQSGEIAAVFQKGYKLGEKIIRFSVVAVAK